MSNTALQTALDGGKVSEKSAVSGLKAAVEKIGGMQERMKLLREHGEEAAMAGVHFTEATATTFLGSMAEGYLGEDKMKLGGVPIRATLGLGLGVWGMANVLRGKSGGHQLAIGQGLLAADAASFGVKAGQALKEKMAEGAAPRTDGRILKDAPATNLPAGRKQLQEGSKYLYNADGTPVLIDGESDDLGKLARSIVMDPGIQGDRREREGRRGGGGWARAR